MINKITSENIQALKKGDVLIKYPLIGEPVESVNFEDKKNLHFMMVSAIDRDRIDLIFPESKEPTLLAGMVVSIGPLHKYKDEIVSDKRWWQYSE